MVRFNPWCEGKYLFILPSIVTPSLEFGGQYRKFRVLGVRSRFHDEGSNPVSICDPIYVVIKKAWSSTYNVSLYIILYENELVGVYPRNVQELQDWK